MKPKALHNIKMEHSFAQNMVVFSHGFGVEKDGGGLFTELVTKLPKNFGYVLFDYNDYDGESTTMSDFTEQARRLSHVVRWVQQQRGVTGTHIIAHSMGCITAALAKPKINGHFIFLAPPLRIGENTRNYYTTKPGAKQDGNRWLIPAASGSTLIVPLSLIDEFEQINAGKKLLDFANTQRLTLVMAGKDEVLGDEDYTDLSNHLNIDFVSILEGDHSFKGKSRKKLISLVKRLLQ